MDFKALLQNKNLMIGIIAGEDKLFESYFNNDAKILLNALVEAGVTL